MRSRLSRPVAALLACATALGTTNAAADTPPPPHVAIELNALDQDGAACRMSFVITNGHTADIAQAVYEAVLFDRAGRVERMMLFDLGALPAARPRVRQFALPDLACAALGRVLINGAATCSGEAVAPTACSAGLVLRSRTDVEVTG